MKKNLLPLFLLAFLAALPAKATQFWYDTITNGFFFRGIVFEFANTNVSVYPFTNALPNTTTTYWLGVANALNDPTRTGGDLSATPKVPIDLKPGIDYQVVVKYDLDCPCV